MSLKKNFLYNLTLTISQFIFPIVTFPYASRILGVNGVGVTSFVESFSRYFLIFAVMGIPIHGMREISKNKENKIITNKIFVEIFSIQFFTTILCTLIYFCSLFFLKDFNLNWKLYLMGGFLILSNIFSLEWVFQGLEDFKYITIRTVILRFLTIILLFLLVKNEDDYTSSGRKIFSSDFFFVFTLKTSDFIYTFNKIMLSFKVIYLYIYYCKSVIYVSI